MIKSLFNEPPAIADHFDPEERLALVQDDSWAFSKSLPANLFSLVISSPPYNIGKEYEERLTLREYLVQQQPLLSELVRMLRADGSICWQVGNYVENGEVFPLDIYYYELFKSLGLQLRNRIIWHFEHGLHCSNRLSGRYETILWFTKTDNYKFHLDPVRVRQSIPANFISRARSAGSRQEIRSVKIRLACG